MFKLVTKQGFLNIKKHWNLYLPYFFFLFFGCWVIIAFFGFVFNFDTTSHQIIDPKFNPSYSLKLFNYGFDDNSETKIKVDEVEKEDLWSFFEKKYSEENQNLLKELIIKSGKQNGYLLNTDFDSSQIKIQSDLNKYNNNVLICWLYESKLFSTQPFSNHWTGFDQTINLDFNNNENNNPINISTFKIENWKQNSPLDIKEWQRKDYLSEFYWIEKNETLKGESDQQIVITPKFAENYYLKIGDSLKLTLSSSKSKEFKIVGIGVKRSRALVDNSQDAYVSPLFYNQLNKNNSDAWMTNLDVASNFQTKKNKDYNQFYQKQFQDYEKILNKYFKNSGQKPFGELKKISTTIAGSLETQLFVYYLLATIICLILFILLIIIYFIISENTIQNQKEQISFLKSLGTNNYWLTYYILIMVIPFILLAFVLAIGLTQFMYYLFESFTLNSIGFNLSQQVFKDWKLIILVWFLIFLISLISYLIVFFKMKKFNFIENNHQGKIKNHLSQKSKKIMIDQIQTKAMFLQNFGLSLQLFLISFFTFLTLGVTFQFLTSINHATQSNQKFFAPYHSYSYQTLKNGQIIYDEQNNEKKLLQNQEFTEFEKVDFSNPQQLEKWASDIYQSSEDISHKYFNQVQEFSLPSTLNTIQKIKNWAVKNTLLQMYHLLDQKLKIYHQSFGNSAINPIVNFKYIIFPNSNYKFSSIFQTNISNRLITTYVDQVFDHQVSKDGVVINFLLAHELDLKVGDWLKIKYWDINSQQQKEINKIIEKIETKINDHYQIILNTTIVQEWSIKKNAIYNQETIPIGLRYLTIPVMQNNGSKMMDYWNFNQERGNNFNLEISSFSLLESAIQNKTNPYTNLLLIISLFMILITVIILVLIGIMFAWQNQQQIALLKIIGYSFKKLIKGVTILFALNLIIAWILASFFSAVIIQQSSNLLLTKILVQITPIFNFQTLGLNLLIGIFMLMTITGWIYILYKADWIHNLSKR